MAKGEIVSSTGRLGLEPRSYNRLYCNWGGLPIQHATTVEGYFRRLSDLPTITTPEGDITKKGRRDVFRGIVTTQALEALVDNNNLSGAHIEAGFPIGDNLWYTYIARNDSNRRSIRPVAEMVSRISENVRPFYSPVEAVRRVLTEGHQFIDDLLPSDTQTQEQLLDLWGETFGWDSQKIANFVQQLNQERKDSRTVWFTGLKNKDGKLTAAAMAELITFKDHQGKPIHIIESTEWRSEESDHIKAVVDHLHAQVLTDYPEGTTIGECNTHRGAHNAAQKSGMLLPDVRIGKKRIPQILVQNVVVVDGLAPHRSLRDFAVFVLPNDAISPEERSQILEMTR